VRQQGERSLSVIRHGAGAAAGGELSERNRSDRRPESHVEELAESALGRRALVLQSHVPLLRQPLQMEGG
jgi:hypothetical protein